MLATGLKPPTIFRIFSYLEAEGFIEPFAAELPSTEEPSRQEKKGRRPVAYVVKKNAYYFIGIEFWVERVSIGVFDFMGSSIYSQTKALSRSEDADKVVDLIASLVEKAIAATSVQRNLIVGVGIGAPGQVDVAERLIVSYPRIPGMKRYPIAGILEKKLGLRVFLHNNCTVIAQSEYRYGSSKDAESMFMLLLRSGV
ncbi:MAG: sugar kinase, partial [Spirochaetae bacterium HGW-Spirochaetae-9]